MGDQGIQLILAGPGSGKTRVITEKILHLVDNGIPASHILALTFSDKAAAEMSDRITQQRPHLDLDIHTFHSFCLDVLKENVLASGLSDSGGIISKTSQLVWRSRNIDTRARREEIPIHIRRSGMMLQRAMAVSWDIRLREESDLSLTRTCYIAHIEGVLSRAAFTFCQYLYAKVNRKRAEAAIRWEEVTGTIEYELPMAILRPRNGRRSRRSCEHAIRKVILLIRPEMAENKERVEH